MASHPPAQSLGQCHHCHLPAGVCAADLQQPPHPAAAPHGKGANGRRPHRGRVGRRALQERKQEGKVGVGGYDDAVQQPGLHLPQVRRGLGGACKAQAAELQAARAPRAGLVAPALGRPLGRGGCGVSGRGARAGRGCGARLIGGRGFWGF